MGKTSGIYKRGETYHFDKVIFGRRICGSAGTSNREEAEKRLAFEIEKVRKQVIYGERLPRTLKEAATKYLLENLHLRSIHDDAVRLKLVVSLVGELSLSRLHDETLKPVTRHLSQLGRKAKTINNYLEIVQRIGNLAAKKWRDENGLTWIEQPPVISLLPITDRRQPYPLAWDEQRYLLDELLPHLQRMTLFKVNTGTREAEVCNLQWDWEVKVPELETFVFIVPGNFVKNGDERLIVCNEIAASIVNEQRGIHPRYVFTYKGNPIKEMGTSSWNKARVRAATKYSLDKGEAVRWGFEHLRVHDLKHTFGRRLRAAGVPLETRKVLLGHKNGDITTHYSAVEVKELLDAAKRVTVNESHKSPALTVLKRKAG